MREHDECRQHAVLTSAFRLALSQDQTYKWHDLLVVIVHKARIQLWLTSMGTDLGRRGGGEGGYASMTA